MEGSVTLCEAIENVQKNINIYEIWKVNAEHDLIRFNNDLNEQRQILRTLHDERTNNNVEHLIENIENKINRIEDAISTSTDYYNDIKDTLNSLNNKKGILGSIFPAESYVTNASHLRNTIIGPRGDRDTVFNKCRNFLRKRTNGGNKRKKTNKRKSKRRRKTRKR